MKIAALSWAGDNIGDDVQSVAVMQHLPSVDMFIPRDHLNSYSGEKALLVLNGWFLSEVRNWPPSEHIVPVFFGFHVQKRAREIVSQHADYLRQHAPIGCRDKATAEFVRSLGVEAYFSYCATLTFEAPADRRPDSIYMVEPEREHRLGKLSNPEKLPIHDVSHRLVPVPAALRIEFAREMIKTYGRTARYVVTSRIHCAMPCVAMGIPTLFTGPVGRRTSIIDEVGIPRASELSLREKILGAKPLALPEPLDIGPLKQRIAKDLKDRIAQTLAKG